MKKKPTKAQRWARERNWNKAQLITCAATLGRVMHSKSTTPGELDILKPLIVEINNLLEGFKGREGLSKILFYKEERYV